MVVREVIQHLHLAHPVTGVRIEDALDGPWQRPEDVPLLIILALGPAALLKVFG
jgi:hypothetical protein